MLLKFTVEVHLIDQILSFKVYYNPTQMALILILPVMICVVECKLVCVYNNCGGTGAEDKRGVD